MKQPACAKMSPPAPSLRLLKSRDTAPNCPIAFRFAGTARSRSHDSKSHFQLPVSCPRAREECSGVRTTAKSRRCGRSTPFVSKLSQAATRALSTPIERSITPGPARGMSTSSRRWAKPFCIIGEQDDRNAHRRGSSKQARDSRRLASHARRRHRPCLRASSSAAKVALSRPAEAAGPGAQERRTPPRLCQAQHLPRQSQAAGSRNLEARDRPRSPRRAGS